jgi:selenide,water dikinase
MPEQVSDKLVLAGGPDDSGVYEINEDQYMVQSVDFFTPIVDNPVDYGSIAAANAMSDVFAMGARPATALNVVGVPYDEVGEDRLADIIEGEADAVQEAGAVIVGGHTVKNPEPIVGLAVTGFVQPDRLVVNGSCEDGDQLFLTKPLGTGIVTTAFQGEGVEDEVISEATNWMKTLNDVGITLAENELVNSMTDITGYGLIGHAQEMLGQGHGARISLGNLPTLTGVRELVEQGSIPGGTRSNWDAFGDRVDLSIENDFGKWIVSDAQTSGGLLLSVPPSNTDRVSDILEQEGLRSKSIGTVTTEDRFELIS